MPVYAVCCLYSTVILRYAIYYLLIYTFIHIAFPFVSMKIIKQTRWIPDNIPLIKPNKAKVIKSHSQANIREVILNCLKCGLNHFETARFYGSSEIQFVTALAGLIEDGTIKREDFIFQTKVHPYEKMEQFVKEWEASW